MFNKQVSIHFLDYSHFPEHGDFHYRFQLRDIRYPGLRLTDDVSLHIFELPGIGQQMTGRPERPLFEWLHFFNHAHEEGDNTMREHYSNPMIHKAFHTLESISADELNRHRAEIRERALKDETAFLNEAFRKGEESGFQKGEESGMKKVALRLIKKHMSVEEVAEFTGLRPDEIRALENELLKDADRAGEA